jgi:hypothetical protein
LLLRTSVDFIHNESLRSGELVYSLYHFADAITEVVGRQIPGVKVRYIGPRDVAASFGITLNGVPQGVTMNTVQQEYFADATVDFLSESSSGRVLDLQIDKQVDNGGSIQVIGRLLGASYRPATAFANELEAAFREGQDVYVQKLITERLRPHAINEIGGVELFEGISSVGGRVDADSDVLTPAPLPGQGQEHGGGNSAMLIVAIGSALGGLVLIGLVYWCRRIRAKSRKEKKEAQGYREKMKQERRARREESKEKFLAYNTDPPEHALGFRETIAPTSDESQSDPYRVTYILPIQFQVKEAKDVLPRRHQQSAPLRSSKSFEDDPTKSLDENEFKSKLDHTSYLGKTDEDNYKAGTATEAPGSAKAKGASRPAALSRFMKAQSESSIDTITWSRSFQLQSSMDISAKSKHMKETEDSLRSSQRKSSQPRSLHELPPTPPRKREPPKASKSLDENEFKSKLGHNPPTLARRSPPQKRAPPKATKSFDGNELRRKLGHTSYLGKTDEDADKAGTAPEAPGSAKAKGASRPAALSRFMKSQSESSINKPIGSLCVQLQSSMDISAKSKHMKETEDSLRSSQRKSSQPRSLHDLPPIPPRKREPPKASKSLDENVFKSKLGHNPPTLARRSPPQKRAPPKATKSFDGNELRRKHGQTFYLGKTGEYTNKAVTAPEAPGSTKAKGASRPAALSRFMKV